MSTAEHKIRLVKKDTREVPRYATMSDELRKLLLNERHTLLMRLSALDEILNLNSRLCTKCGDGL